MHHYHFIELTWNQYYENTIKNFIINIMHTDKQKCFKWDTNKAIIKAGQFLQFSRKKKVEIRCTYMWEN